MATILIIDDEPDVAATMADILRRAGHAIAVAADGLIGETWLRQHRADLVITDLLMPEQEGIDTIRHIRRTDDAMPILAMTGGGRWGANVLLEAAMVVGATEILAKPFGRGELTDKVATLLRRA